MKKKAKQNKKKEQEIFQSYKIVFTWEKETTKDIFYFLLKFFLPSRFKFTFQVAENSNWFTPLDQILCLAKQNKPL